MKRFYLILVIMVAGVMPPALAQNADLGTSITMQSQLCLDSNMLLTPMDSFVNGVLQPLGVWAVKNNGPSTIPAGSSIMVVTPRSVYNPITLTVGVFIVNSQINAPSGSTVISLSYLPTDSIKTLLDLDIYDSTHNFFASIVRRQDLVNGHTYGFYFWVLGVGTNPNAPTNTDNDSMNDIAVVPIVWHCTGGSNGPIITFDADLQTSVSMSTQTCIDSGTTIYPDDTTVNGVTQPKGTWSVINNGPETIVPSSYIMGVDPSCSFDTIAGTINVITRQTSVTAPPGSVCWQLSDLPADSIKSLIDINIWQNGGTLMDALVAPQDFQNGHTYGFYFWVLGLGQNPADPANEDTTNNNLNYIPIVWNCSDTTNSVHEMIKEAAKHIYIYPNPTQNTLHFRYGFIRNNTQAYARVVDMTGRVLLTQKLGTYNMGTDDFNVNVSGLAEGNYMLEISTGYIKAVGKFTIQR